MNPISPRSAWSFVLAAVVGLMSLVAPPASATERADSAGLQSTRLQGEVQPPRAVFNYRRYGTTLAFSDHSFDGDGRIVAYRWDFGDGTTSTRANPAPTFAKGGEYEVSLTVTDSTGIADTRSEWITLDATLHSSAFEAAADGGNQPPIALFDYDREARTLTFINASFDSDGSIVAHAWNFGDGTTSTEAEPVHTFASNGVYDVSLTVTDDDGATDTRIESIRLNHCDDPAALQNGVPVTGIRLNQNFCSLYYKLEVPAGARGLSFEFDRGPGAEGNAVMSVRFDALPEWGAYDCRTGGSDDPPSCEFPEPQTGTYYVRLETTGDIYDGTLLASFIDPASEPHDLTATAIALPNLRTRVDLRWAGGERSIDIVRNGQVIHSTRNRGGHIDSFRIRGSGTMTYRICNTGTRTCSNRATIRYGEHVQLPPPVGIGIIPVIDLRIGIGGKTLPIPAVANPDARRRARHLAAPGSAGGHVR